jgi:Cytochrome P450
MRRILKTPQPVLDELRDQYGPVCAMGAGPMRMAIVGAPDALDDLFATSNESFRWGHKFNVLGFVVGPGSMIVSDGPDHKRRRSSVQTAFARRRLNSWVPTIVERTDAAVDRLARELAGETRTIDLYPVGRQIVLEVVVRALFGERLAQRTQEIGDLFQRPQDYLESPAIKQMPHPFPFTARAKVRADRAALDAILDEEIADRRRHPTDDPHDTLGSLVQDATMSDSEIRDQMVTLIGAGYDTTAASLAWMVWCAALEPAIWSQLRVEADEVFGPLGAPEVAVMVDHTVLNRLGVADRVMRETLRLHPAGVLSPREAVVDVRVGEYVIPRGTLILWSAYLAGRDPEAWADPKRFDPDRFLDLTPEQKTIADHAWVPFGRGARNCIGFALAQMELTLMISRLAQRLDVTPLASVAPQPVGMVVNRPVGGVPMRVALRD